MVLYILDNQPRFSKERLFQKRPHRYRERWRCSINKCLVLFTWRHKSFRKQRERWKEMCRSVLLVCAMLMLLFILGWLFWKIEKKVGKDRFDRILHHGCRVRVSIVVVRTTSASSSKFATFAQRHGIASRSFPFFFFFESFERTLILSHSHCVSGSTT